MITKPDFRPALSRHSLPLGPRVNPDRRCPAFVPGTMSQCRNLATTKVAWRELDQRGTRQLLDYRLCCASHAEPLLADLTADAQVNWLDVTVQPLGYRTV